MTKKPNESNWDSIADMLVEVMERRDARSRTPRANSTDSHERTEEQLSEKRFRDRYRYQARR